MTRNHVASYRLIPDTNYFDTASLLPKWLWKANFAEAWKVRKGQGKAGKWEQIADNQTSNMFKKYRWNNAGIIHKWYCLKQI